MAFDSGPGFRENELFLLSARRVLCHPTRFVAFCTLREDLNLKFPFADCTRDQTHRSFAQRDVSLHLLFDTIQNTVHLAPLDRRQKVDHALRVILLADLVYYRLWKEYEAGKAETFSAADWKDLFFRSLFNSSPTVTIRESIVKTLHSFDQKWLPLLNASFRQWIDNSRAPVPVVFFDEFHMFDSHELGKFAFFDSESKTLIDRKFMHVFSEISTEFRGISCHGRLCCYKLFLATTLIFLPKLPQRLLFPLST